MLMSVCLFSWFHYSSDAAEAEGEGCRDGRGLAGKELECMSFVEIRVHQFVSFSSFCFAVMIGAILTALLSGLIPPQLSKEHAQLVHELEDNEAHVHLTGIEARIALNERNNFALQQCVPLFPRSLIFSNALLFPLLPCDCSWFSLRPFFLYCMT